MPLSLSLARFFFGLVTLRLLGKYSQTSKGSLLLTKYLGILPVRLVLPAVWYLIIKRWVGNVSDAKAYTVGSVLRVLGRRFGRLYISVEAVFFIYYLYEKFNLSRRVPLPVADIDRKVLFAKVLGSLETVTVAGNQNQSRPRSRKNSQRASVMLMKTQSQGHITSESILRNIKSQDWARDQDLSGLILKRSCFTSWFNSADLEKFKRGNLGEYLCEAFFEGRTMEELNHKPEERQELEEMIDMLCDWMEVELLDGNNPSIKHLSLVNSPLPARYRPAFVYVMTHFLVPHITLITMKTFLGFTNYTAGTLTYWLLKRPTSSGKEPIVFCHGLGIGTLPYTLFLYTLIQEFPDQDIFVIYLPFIAMRPAAVPSPGEACTTTEEMLRTWGYSEAYFIGHSYGSFFLAWIHNKNPSLISGLFFLDPTCFLLLKPDLALNCLFSDQKTAHSAFFAYWVAGELWLSHTLTRKFRWYENSVWPESVNVPCLVSLSGTDNIVPSYTIKAYIDHEISKRAQSPGDRPPLVLHWIDNGFHGQVLTDYNSRKILFDKIREMISYQRFAFALFPLTFYGSLSGESHESNESMG
jgi:pimeloyl-ACP methyl ester carboxylesterase